MSPEPRIARLGIRVRRERAEEALAALLPILAAGAEETEPDPDTVEYAIYGPQAELPACADVRALAGDALVATEVTQVAPGWERRWHAHLQAVEVAAGGRRLRVRAPWLPADPGAIDLVIDPGELFGAGGHPTTRLCLELLLDCASRRGRASAPDADGPLCDWGAGSGVLAVAAARLGFGPVDAVEAAPGAAAVIEGNAAANGVRVRTHRLDLAKEPAPWAPTVTANLPLALLAAIAAESERPPETLIASGVLAERADELSAAWAPRGLRETERRVQEAWAAVRLDRA